MNNVNRCALMAAATVGVVGVALSARQQSSPMHDWPSYGLSWNEQRLSPLTQINVTSIKNLGLAWSIDLPTSAGGLQGTPLAIGKALYFTTSMSIVYAVDATSGRELWRYDPVAGKTNPRAMRTSLGVNRGLAYSDGALFLGAVDGRLILLDAKTGKVNWSVDTFEEPDARKTITGAPRVFNGKVIIGSAGGDSGVRGYVTAYDVKNGRKAWRFYVVPGNPANGLAPTNGFFYVLDRKAGKLISAEKMGKVTWAERIDLQPGRPIEAPNIRYENGPVTFWPSPQGMHNWHAMSFNPQTGLVYVPTLKLAATYEAKPEDVANSEMQIAGSRRYWQPIGARFRSHKVDSDDGTGALVAWDPIAQKERWKIQTPCGWAAVKQSSPMFDEYSDDELRDLQMYIWQISRAAKQGAIAPSAPAPTM